MRRKVKDTVGAVRTVCFEHSQEQSLLEEQVFGRHWFVLCCQESYCHLLTVALRGLPEIHWNLVNPVLLQRHVLGYQGSSSRTDQQHNRWWLTEESMVVVSRLVC